MVCFIPRWHYVVTIQEPTTKKELSLGNTWLRRVHTSEEKAHHNRVEYTIVPGDFSVGHEVMFRPEKSAWLKQTIDKFHPEGFEVGVKTVYKVVNMTLPLFGF